MAGWPVALLAMVKYRQQDTRAMSALVSLPFNGCCVAWRP